MTGRLGGVSGNRKRPSPFRIEVGDSPYKFQRQRGQIAASHLVSAVPTAGAADLAFVDTGDVRVLRACDLRGYPLLKRHISARNHTWNSS
jgi:hypothetical protein